MALLVTSPNPPCVLFEDDDLLVVTKPPGINTHTPHPHHNEGLYDWLRNRHPRWTTLGIVQRLDKETSGVLLFTKSTRANQSLAAQFAQRSIDKRYLFLTDRPAPSEPRLIRTAMVRVGPRYLCRPPHAGADIAETRFTPLGPLLGHQLIEARPLTGRPHQIRVHAAQLGFPILGDTLYGGSPAQRLFLHSQQLNLRHPANDKPITFTAESDFNANPAHTLRIALIAPLETNVYRVLHGAGDHQPGWYIDRLGPQLLSHSERALDEAQQRELDHWMTRLQCTGAYHKQLVREPGSSPTGTVVPRHLLGPTAPNRFTVLENGVQYALSFNEGYSIGLFLDQRDNRHRLLTRHVAARFPFPDPTQSSVSVLNTFAYTCAFSTCAALAGAHTTSIDLSRKYLDWGKANFTLNGLDPAQHSFLHGDTFQWLRRLSRQQRTFDVVLLDPPTFSRSKTSGIFRAETDYPALVTAALPLLKPRGVLFASTNATRLDPATFLDQLTRTIQASHRSIRHHHYAPQPPDFPITRDEPAHLKTAWFRLD